MNDFFTKVENESITKEDVLRMSRYCDSLVKAMEKEKPEKYTSAQWQYKQGFILKEISETYKWLKKHEVNKNNN